MIKLEISGVHLHLNPQQRDYVRQKIGQLDHLLPAHAQKSVQGRVTLNQTSTRRGTVKCEVILTVPHKTLSVKQTAFDVLEAVDKAADKMARCCRKYKTGQSKTSRRGLIRWFRHRVWPGN